MNNFNKNIKSNKSVEPINQHAGNLLAHFKRYIQEATSSGILNMPIYESKMVDLNKGQKMSFNAGDTVQLKCGGEVMTIEEIDNDSATCIQFDNKKVERDTFLLITLKIVEQFYLMIKKGLEDSKNGKTISSKEMEQFMKKNFYRLDKNTKM